jgi:hypothetical protein
VPLSEHEQRLLEQIEQALYAEDPKFAQTWRVRDLRSLQRARAVRAGALILLGLGLLVAGVVIQGSTIVVGVILGVVGFLAMLGGAWLAMASRQRPVRPAGPPSPARRQQPRESWRSRLESRWQRRQDERGL